MRWNLIYVELYFQNDSKIVLVNHSKYIIRHVIGKKIHVNTYRSQYEGGENS